MALNTNSLDLEATSSQYASAVDSASLSPTGDMTIECWVNFESLPATDAQMRLVSKYTASNHSYVFGLNDNSGTLQLNGISSADGSIDTNVLVNWTPLTATWYHVAVVFDIGVGTLFYVNGSQQGTTQSVAASIFNGNSALLVGAHDGPTTFLDGKIDEVRIWSVARTEAQLLANKDDHIDPGTANLNAYWRLNNGYSDETSNNNSLTSSGSPVFSTDVPFAGSPDIVGAYSFFM